MPKRLRGGLPPPAPTIINNIQITNYFAAGPTPVASDDAPKNLFETNADRGKKTTLVKNGKPCSVWIIYSSRDGTLKGSCYNTCKRQFVDINWFAPTPGVPNSAANSTKFLEALDAYKTAYTNGDRDEALVQRDIVEKLRIQDCITCRPDPGYLTPEKKECKDWYDAKRKEMCAQNNGCAHADCPERGENVWCIITADHGTNPKIKNKTTGKPLNLSHYNEWPAHGGVAGMEVESEQIEKYICKVCHILEPTSNAGNRCLNPNDPNTPKGKSSCTDEEVKQYKRWRSSIIRYPKQKYVDDAKHHIGCCAHCKRRVLPGLEAGFDFDHLEEATKSKGGLFGKHGGVSGLVNNHANAAALALVRVLLDAEMALCQLLCSNCHHRKTNGYPASTTVY